MQRDGHRATCEADCPQSPASAVRDSGPLRPDAFACRDFADVLLQQILRIRFSGSGFRVGGDMAWSFAVSLAVRSGTETERATQLSARANLNLTNWV
jgi:hypothetical protein